MRGAIVCGHSITSSGRVQNEGKIERYSQDLFQVFFIHGHLNSDVRKVIVYFLVRPRLDGRVVFGVLVVLRNRANAIRNALDDLEGKILDGGG